MQYSLQDGTQTQIDETDLALLEAHRWCAPKRPRFLQYVRRAVWLPGRQSCTTILLHREILKAPTGLYVDHINGDTLDNRRANLRVATPKQSAANRRSQSGSSSRYLGVTWHTGCSRWQAQIGGSGDTAYLGLFSDEAEAARTYDVAARKRYGEFARLNFPAAAPAYAEAER